MAATDRSHPRTSSTHPLRIDMLDLPDVPGRIGMTFCPGKKDPFAMSGHWDRDLEQDLDAISRSGGAMVVSLIEEHELSALHVAHLPRALQQRGLQWLHLPIEDGGVPDKAFEQAWREAAPRIREQLQAGRVVVLHCRGGLGRTGLVAARLLVESGATPPEAVRAVRAVRPGAIENRRQEEYVLAQERRCSRGWLALNTARGCLLGGAVGDALGAPVEFMSLAAIRGTHGTGVVTGYAPAYGRRGAVTDDTQMTLFTVEGLLRSQTRMMDKGRCDPVEVVYHAYRRWLETQTFTTTPPDAGDEQRGWLVQVAALHARRAPGGSCLSALHKGRIGRLGRTPINNSKGCGGVMRMAPVGLFVKSEMSFYMGSELAALTHGHPSGYLAAGALARIIAGIRDGAGLREAVEWTLEELRQKPKHEECLAAVQQALELLDAPPTPETVERLGQGWVAEEALAIALYCSLALEHDFEGALGLAVTHSGDSDSTGAIAGNILGALHGATAIPSRWLEELELCEVIEELARDLVTAYEDTPQWRSKYPPC